MSDLIKIKDVSDKYDITARTLRYYEDMGLIESSRSDEYAYRLYDENAVRRIEQILILRKLNISIKDIQRIFNTSGSDAVLDVLGKKVDDIDGEVSLLHELKSIILDFIAEIKQVDFGKGADIKSLYDKANEIETRLVNVDYGGNPATVNRLAEITEKLNSNKMPEVRVIQIPKCKVATSGAPDTTNSKVWDFSNWWSDYEPKRRYTKYYPYNDFLFGEDGGAVWWMMVEDDATSEDCGGYEIIDFEGGLYAVHTAIDGDGESNSLVIEKIMKWIESTNFEFDEIRGRRYCMGHMINPTEEIKKGLGYHQYELFVPIKLKGE